MANGTPDFTIDQAMQAQRALRAALGLGEERFPLPAFIGMISDEIEQLREAGRSDHDIVEIVAQATGIRIETTDIGRFYASPGHRHGPSGPG